MGQVLSSAALCSRGRVEAEVPELDLRPEERQSVVSVIGEQPQSVTVQQVRSDTQQSCEDNISLLQNEQFETAIDNENHKPADDEKAENVPEMRVEETEPPEMTVEETEAELELEEPDDGNVEVSLDDEDQEDTEKVDEAGEEETYRKTSPDLDTAAAITNILSEIVGDSDSRAVVGR